MQGILKNLANNRSLDVNNLICLEVAGIPSRCYKFTTSPGIGGSFVQKAQGGFFGQCNLYTSFQTNIVELFTHPPQKKIYSKFFLVLLQIIIICWYQGALSKSNWSL